MCADTKCVCPNGQELFANGTCSATLVGKLFQIDSDILSLVDPIFQTLDVVYFLTCSVENISSKFSLFLFVSFWQATVAGTGTGTLNNVK